MTSPNIRPQLLQRLINTGLDEAFANDILNWAEKRGLEMRVGRIEEENQQLRDAIKRAGFTLIEGDFVLRNGNHTMFYIDGEKPPQG